VIEPAKTVHSSGTRSGEPCALCGGPTLHAIAFTAWKCLRCGAFCHGLISEMGKALRDVAAAVAASQPAPAAQVREEPRCAACGGNLPEGVRKGTKTCSQACRKRLSRNVSVTSGRPSLSHL
jgi:ribosomal protein L37AE/L43A